MVYPNGAFKVTQYIVLDHARWCENNTSLSMIYTFVFSSCFKTHHQIKYLSAWLCKMFLSASLPCPALIIATPSQPSIRQVRHLTFLLVHSFCNIFTLFTFLFQSYFHFHRNMIKTFVSTCVQGSKLLFTCAFTSFYCYSE